MQTTNCGALVRLHKYGSYLKICLLGNPGPFPFGAPGTMGKGQYIGIAKHLVLTLMEDRYLPGMLAFQADCPMTPDGQPVMWVGGVLVQPWANDLWYHIHPLFLRDIDQLLAEAADLQLAAIVTGVNGRISRRQYWLVEIPAITPEVLLNIDEVVVVRKRAINRPKVKLASKTARGEFWQTGAFKESPVYQEKTTDFPPDPEKS
jgi:hypothetical protein